MIFVTVGTQLPFDRMIKIIDNWCGENNIKNAFAQIGPSSYSPKNMKFAKFITPVEFDELSTNCEVIIAHAGMGSVITALEKGKPILIFPRKADLLEHRNDHQVATAKWLANTGKVSVAMNDDELWSQLQNLEELKTLSTIGNTANAELLDALSSFLNG